jgi:streptogramin lyase
MEAAQKNEPVEKMNAPLAIVDAATLAVELVSVCPAPHGVQVSADSKTAYVACYATDQLGVVDLDTHAVELHAVGTAPIDPTSPTHEPYAVAIHPVDGSVWVSDLATSDLRVFDPASKTWDARGPVAVGGPPFFGQFSTDGAYFFVPVQALEALVVVDAATGDVVTTLELQPAACRAPHAVLLMPDDETLLVVCEGDHVEPGTVAVVNVLNPATPAVVKAITVGVFPDDAFLVLP